MTANPMPVIFLSTANDRDNQARYLRNLSEEARQAQSALASAEQRGHCELVQRQNATIADILDVFQDVRYRDRIAIFHFGGHADGYRLLLETAAGAPAAVDAGGLARFLAQQRGLQLVFLNGCSTEGQVADMLMVGVPAVIATDQAVDDAQATTFATRFYRGLAGGAAIAAAYEEARAAMQMAGAPTYRHLGAAEVLQEAKGIPWRLHVRPGAEAVTSWSLPLAARDPLFGLPALPPLDLPDKPYRYLDWYRREDASVFFGRGREIRELYDRVTAPGCPPLVLFYGQSGVGKSSLLTAGLLPRLEGSHIARYARRDKTAGMLGTLAAALGVGLGDDIVAAWRMVETQTGRPLLVVLDQVEELFTRPNLQQPDELAQALDGLETLFADAGRQIQGRLILGFRKEWLAELDRRLAERRLPRDEVFLERLGREGIAEIVTGPQSTPRLVERYRLAVTEALPGLIADDLLTDRESPVAPMLAILLADMWEAAKVRNYDRPAFDEDLYHEFRSRGLSLDDFLGRQLQALNDRQPNVVASGLALDVLAYHTTPLGTAEQRTPADLEHMYSHRRDALSTLIQECRDLYLLVDPSQNRPGQPPASRLTHDTLAPHVRKRFDESDAPGQRARRILESRAVDWEAGKTGVPLDPADLAFVEAGQAGMRNRQPHEEVLVTASRIERTRRQAEAEQIASEREQARQRTLEQANRLAEEQRLRAEEGERAARHLRLRLIAATGAVAIAAIAFAAAVWFGVDASKQRDNARTALVTATVSQGQAEIEAFNARSAEATAEANATEAERQYRIALARQYATQSRMERGDTGLLLAIKATLIRDPVTQQYLWETEETLRETLERWSHWQRNLGAHQGRVRALDFFGDDRYVISGAQDGRILEWLTDGSAAPTLMLETAAGTEVYSLAIDQQRNRLAVGTSHGVIHLLNVQDARQKIATWQAHEEPNPVLSLAFAPDGAHLVSGGGDRSAKIWRVDAIDDPIATITAQDWVRTVAISSNGQWLALGSDDRFWSLWRLNSYENPTQVFTGAFQARVNAVSFNVDSSVVAAGSEDGTIHIVDLRNPKDAPIVLKHPLVASGIRTLVFGRSPTQMLLGTLGGDLVEVDLLQQPPDWRPLASLDTSIEKIAVSTSGQTVTTGDDKGNVRLWSLEVGLPEPQVFEGHSERVRALVFIGSEAIQETGSNRAWLISASEDGTIFVWSSDGQVQRTLRIPGSAFLSADTSPDGRWLAAGGKDQIVRLWALDDLAAQPIELKGHQDEIVSVRFSSTGDLLATGGSDRRVLLWDLTDTPAAPITLDGPQQGVLSVAFSPDGKLLAVGDQAGGVYLWELQHIRNGAKQIGQHDSWVRSVSFSPDSRSLVSAGDDGLLKMISVSQDASIQTVSAHRGGVRWAAFSPDGTILATAGDDRTVKLWQSADLAQEPVTLRGHTAIVRTLAFSPDGRWLVSGGDDRLIYMWTIHLGDIQKMACARVAADFSEDEWRTFFGSEPYVLICDKEAPR